MHGQRASVASALDSMATARETPAVPERIFLSVAEASADANAARLVSALSRRLPEATFHGLGGPAMAAAGVHLLAETTAGAAMGLRAFGRAAEVRRLLKQADAFYAEAKPDLAVCCDSWTMNVHFAKLAKRHGVPVLWYVAPQAWASRPGRARRLGHLADMLACIFPFEPAFFSAAGVDVRFVGHPLLEEVPVDLQATPDTPPPIKHPSSPPVVGLPCGSRRSVAKANLPRQLAVAEHIRKVFPGVRFIVPTTDVTHELAEALVAGVKAQDVELHKGTFDESMSRCDAALCTSGTATLRLAVLGVPMVVVYAASPVMWHGLGRWLIRTRTFAMPNILAAGDPCADPAGHVVPEFVPWYGPVESAAEALTNLLAAPRARLRQREALARAVETLRGPRASEQAAEAAIEVMARRGG